jgi:hypothetical protein
MWGGIRHLLVDTQGWLLAIKVHAADESRPEGRSPTPSSAVRPLPALRAHLGRPGLSRASAQLGSATTRMSLGRAGSPVAIHSSLSEPALDVGGWNAPPAVGLAAIPDRPSQALARRALLRLADPVPAARPR